MTAILAIVLACYANPSWAEARVLTWDPYPAQEKVRLCIAYDRGSHYGWNDEWVLLACIPSGQPSYELRPFTGEGLVRVRVVAVKSYRPAGCNDRYCEEHVESPVPHPSLCAGTKLQMIQE